MPFLQIIKVLDSAHFRSGRLYNSNMCFASQEADKKINTMTKNERFEIRLSLALADENLPDTQT